MFWLFVMLACLSLPAAGQFGAKEGGGAAQTPPASVKHNDDPIKIVRPSVDVKRQSVTLPAMFWNQKMVGWIEVAACGRPSDFLHETIIATTTTKTLMEQAMRQAGFHDADAWAKSVREFPRVRGDRFLITLAVTRKDKPGSPVEEYSLDELLAFQGWGVPAGPYGWMFKGNPERGDAASEPADNDKEGGGGEDRTKILRDDPQIALVFKGIQHQSQSYAEHPLAYDDWIYPMMRYSRNYQVLPAEVYDSNGEFPVTMTLTKCTEEEFLTQSAKLWHDPAYAKYMLEQMPTAKQIDKDKIGLIPLLQEMEVAKYGNPGSELQKATAARIDIQMAKIEKGYATLDAAWAKWAAEHPVYESTNNDELADLKLQTKRWREHMEQKRTWAEQHAIDVEAFEELRKLGPKTEENKKQWNQLAGKQLEASSRAVLAQGIQPREYWKWEQGRLSPDDPRKSWVATIHGQVEMLDTRNELGTTGLAYARALQSASPEQVESAKKLYDAAIERAVRAELNLKLVNINFEIEKRESFPDDPDLPVLRQQKQQLEELLKKLPTATK